MAAKKADPINIGGLRAEYDLLSAQALSLCQEVVRQLERLISSANATLGFPIESRVKTWTSIEEKWQRKELRLTNLTALHDLVGIRIVLLFARDVDPILEALKSHFEIVKIEDAQDKLGADRFGYLSKHCVVYLRSEWSQVPTFANLPKLHVEIQVRTLAQHIWAAASHKLQYKREQSVPLPVRRTLNRVAALLETVDLEMERLLDERSDYRQAISDSRRSKPSDDDKLNVDLLEKVLDELLPAENKSSDEQYDVILKELHKNGVSTVGQLRALIAQRLPAQMRREAEYVARSRASLKERGTVPGTSVERVQRGVYFAHMGLVRGML